MTKDEALDLALEALVYASSYCDTYDAITAIKQARALDKMADNARELGLDYEPVQEPVAWMDRDGDLYANEPDKNWCPPHYPLYTTPPAAQPAPDLQAELEATNRQVEILSDALAESRREVAQLKSQPAPLQEPVVWMYVNKSTHETKFQKHMRDFVDHSLWSEVPLYGEPLANHELQCVCGAVWCGDEMVHLPYKHPQAQRKPLTDEEIWQLVDGTNGSVTAFARAIEAKLKEKNT